MYHLVATVGSEARNSSASTSSDQHQVLTVLGGKASCRRKFVINVQLVDDDGNLVVDDDLSVIASVVYALDCSPIVPDEHLFLAEPPLLTTFNGVEYPSLDRPTRLVAGKASFKLAISLLSSKHDNRLFCICFTPHFSSSSPDHIDPTDRPLVQPCYSRPIRSISRKRTPAHAQHCTTAVIVDHHPLSSSPCPPSLSNPIKPAPICKIKSVDTSEEVEGFFRGSTTGSSSEEDGGSEAPKDLQDRSLQASLNRSESNERLRYICNNNFMYGASLLRPDHHAISSDRATIFSARADEYSTKKSDHQAPCGDPTYTNARFSPHPLALSRSKSTSPSSGILTSEGSIDHDGFNSEHSPIASTERTVGAPHPVTGPFRPYASVGACKVPSPDFSRSSSTRVRGSPPLHHGLRRSVVNPVQQQAATTTTSSSSRNKHSLDSVLQRFLSEAGSHSGSLSLESSFEEEEKSLRSLELTLQEAIIELEKRKDELRNKRRRLLEEDKARVHDIVFHSSSWIESLSSRFNF